MRTPLPTALLGGPNPIEQAFSKVKGLLRRAEARARDVLTKAMGAALSTIIAQDASGFFRHCGSAPTPGQLMRQTLQLTSAESAAPITSFSTRLADRLADTGTGLAYTRLHNY